MFVSRTCLNPLLYDILLRFLVHNYGLTADIEKAYLQVSVVPEHRNYLRFLWFDDVYKNNPEIVKYRFTRVIFGSSPLQFLLNGTVKTHVEKYEEIDPKFVWKVLRHFFVDDFNCGVESYEQGVELYKKVKSHFMEGNFNVRKWRTSNNNLQEFINRQEQSKSSDKKVFGMHRNENCGVFVTNLNDYIKEAKRLAPTKRNVLKIIAGFYDLIGFIQPIIVSLKILFQEICSVNISWDEKLNETLTSKWLESTNIMSQVKEVIVPRCYHFNRLEDPIATIELHGFSGSSILAYGGCIYLKFGTSTGKISISFVTSKSRIVPAKKTDLIVPRLELLGNFVLSKFVVNVLSALKKDIVINSVYCWTDSQISLAWIRSINKEV